MKKYFAKYIILDGEEIKKGDKYYSECGASDREVHIAKEDNPKGDYLKVELSLCSRDIKLGDTIHISTSKSKTGVVESCKPDDESGLIISYLVDGCFYGADLCYKILGKISRHALWVKEGDEFDDSEIDQKVETKMMEERWWIQERDGDEDEPLKEITLEELLEEDLKDNPYLESYKIVARYSWKDAEDEAEVVFRYKEYLIKGPCGHFH